MTTQEVWWCLEHDAGLRQTDSFPPDTCWAFTADADSCSMVQASLLIEESNDE